MLYIAPVAAAVFVSLLILRAFFTPRPPRRRPPLADSGLGQYAGIEEKLATLVRIPTVSSRNPGEKDDAAFADFRDALQELFPLVHARLRREDIGNRAILYSWERSAP